MKNPYVNPASGSSLAGPQGAQGLQGNISTESEYKNFSKLKTEKYGINNCSCYVCRDSAGYEYKNEIILDDFSPLIHQMFEKDLTK